MNLFYAQCIFYSKQFGFVAPTLQCYYAIYDMFPQNTSLNLATLSYFCKAAC